MSSPGAQHRTQIASAPSISHFNAPKTTRNKGMQILLGVTDLRYKHRLINMSENMEPTVNQNKDETESLESTAKRNSGNVIDAAEAKRSRVETTHTATTPATTSTDDEVIDLARTMDLKVGDRLEIEWELDNGDNDEDDGPSETIVHWWGATLLEHDGRTDEGVAIRTLQYDPYPERGFPDSSNEDVIFMGRDFLICYPSQDELNYRTLTDDGSEVAYVVTNEQDVEDLVDSILTSALSKKAANFEALPRAQQAILAEKIASKKEKLIQLMKDHMSEQRAAGINRPVTAQDAKNLLARTMMND
jgi:hypothetical protein